jgi:RND family efflux transporter MFP subunit
MRKRLDFRCGSSGRLLVPLLTAAVLVNGCGKEAEQAPEVVRPVKILTIGNDGEGGRREYPGRVVAAEEVLLGFEVPGRIIELPVREGQDVAAGALIAKLDDRDYVAQLDREKARRNQARANFERNQSLYERDAISLRDLEVVRRRFEVTEADLHQAEKALADTRLLAPFDGRIANRQVENFENVRAKQPVVMFLDDSTLEIKASFPESDFLRMNQAGSLTAMTEMLKPRVEVSAAPGILIQAYVKEMRNVADAVTRTFEVTLGFDSPEGLSIASGMTAKVMMHLPAGTAGRTLVPTAAVTGDAQGRSIVWVFDEAAGVVNARQVEVKQMTGGSIEIVSGLAAGDRIAVLGAKNLREGMRVRPHGQ